MMREDADIVARVLAGDRDAFATLVAKYDSLGGAVAFGVLGDLALAEDAVQEAFLRAFRSLATLRDPARFRFWFAGIVRKKAIDLQRSLRSQRRLEGRPGTAFLDVAAANDDSVEAGAIDAEEREKVLDALAAMTEEDRTVLALKYLDGLSYKEIAEVTHASVASVESRLFRARGVLRKKLSNCIERDP